MQADRRMPRRLGSERAEGRFVRAQFAKPADLGVRQAAGLRYRTHRMHPALGSLNRTSAPEGTLTWPPKTRSRAAVGTQDDATTAGCISPHPRA